jgi:hypothetical protein
MALIARLNSLAVYDGRKKICFLLRLSLLASFFFLNIFFIISFARFPISMVHILNIFRNFINHHHHHFLVSLNSTAFLVFLFFSLARLLANSLMILSLSRSITHECLLISPLLHYLLLVFYLEQNCTIKACPCRSYAK